MALSMENLNNSNILILLENGLILSIAKMFQRHSRSGKFLRDDVLKYTLMVVLISIYGDEVRYRCSRLSQSMKISRRTDPNSLGIIYHISLHPSSK